jgi:V8-like Glu-specific endopeptidase
MSLPRLEATRLAFACAAALLASATWATGATAASGPREAGNANRTAAEVQEYWTPERMENARPLEVTIADGGDPARARSPSAPAFSSFELTNTTSYPNRVHGKVFFTRPGVGNFACSGTVVDALNRATVITAGHCVHRGGTWSTNFAFAPGYRRQWGTGNAPYGVWAATGEAAPRPWVESQNLKFDVGAAIIARNSLGWALQDIVGARGVAFDQPPFQSLRSYGYPAEATSEQPFDGTRLWACDSGAPVTVDSTSASGPATLAIGCDMTGGSSGGGWVTGGGALSGVNSHRYLNQPDVMYGPYFGSTIKELYDFASAQPPGTPGSYAVGNPSPDLPNASPDASRPGQMPRPPCKKAKKKRKKKRAARRACKVKRV